MQCIWRDRRTFSQKLPCYVFVPDCSFISHGAACFRDRVKAHPQKDEFFFFSIQSLFCSVPYSRSVLFHIRLSDITQNILSESFNATNTIPYMILVSNAHVRSLLNWIYRVFINYATVYMPGHIWNFLNRNGCL